MRTHREIMHGNDMVTVYPDSMAGRLIPLYVHVPFCESLCPFCPFHRVLLNEPLADAYLDLLVGQLEILASKGYNFSELCVGGGTPTTRTQGLLKLIHKAGSLWDLQQITVETNPNHLRHEILEPLQRAGVTRLSVGVQSLQDHQLQKLGRLDAYGDRDRILDSIGRALGIFDTFNVDMIFNLPGQSLEELDQDVALLKASGVDQISYHPLMPTDDHLQAGSAFGKVDFKQEATMYRRVVSGLAPEYQMASVWCFNRKPQLIDEYFVYNANYLGIGSGAFSLLDGYFYATDFDIQRYMNACRAGGNIFVMRHPLGGIATYAYRLLTRLFGVRVPVEQMKDLRAAMVALRWLGMVRPCQRVTEVVGDRSAPVRREHELTDRGCYTWLVMMRRFFMNVNRYRQQLRRGEDVPCPFTVNRVMWRLLWHWA